MRGEVLEGDLWGLGDGYQIGEALDEEDGGEEGEGCGGVVEAADTWLEGRESETAVKVRF